MEQTVVPIDEDLKRRVKQLEEKLEKLELLSTKRRLWQILFLQKPPTDEELGIVLRVTKCVQQVPVPPDSEILACLPKPTVEYAGTVLYLPYLFHWADRCDYYAICFSDNPPVQRLISTYSDQNFNKVCALVMDTGYCVLGFYGSFEFFSTLQPVFGVILFS